MSEDFEDHADDRPALIEAVDKAERRLMGLAKGAALAGVPLVTAYLFKLCYNLRHASGIDDVSLPLEIMRKVYEGLEDKSGLGLYWLIRGDHNISPAFTSPLVLNFDLIDGTDEFGGNSTMYHPGVPYKPVQEGMPAANLIRDQVGDNEDHDLENSPRNDGPGSNTLASDSEAQDDVAEHCYQRALQYFRGASSSRGVASVTLRLACLHRMTKMRSAMFWPHSSETGKTIRLLQESIAMSNVSGDLQLTKLAEAHQLLTVEHIHPVEKYASRKLGRWAQDTQNEILVLYIALLGLKIGLYYRYHTGLYHRSFAASEVSRQITKNVSFPKLLWYQVMLFQVSIYKSIELHRQAVIWANHLKDSWPTMVLECLGPLNANGSDLNTPDHELGVQERFAIAALALQMVVGAIAPLEHSDDNRVNTSPQSYISLSKMVEWIAAVFKDSDLGWVDQQKFRIHYYSEIASYRRLRQEGSVFEANHQMTSFLESQLVTKQTDLRNRLLVIEAHIMIGDDDMGRQLLAMVDDTDQLQLSHSVIGRGRSVEAAVARQRLAMKSLELIFLACVRVKEWGRARLLMDQLERASPGFFTGVRSYTKLWPWKRCLYAGLVLESEERYNDALLYFLQASWFFHQLQLPFILPEDQRMIRSGQDFTRVMSSLGRRHLRWELDQPGATQIYAISDARFDARLFRMFSVTIDYKELGGHHGHEALCMLEGGRPQHIWKRILSSTTSSTVLAAYYQYRLWIDLYGKAARTSDEEAEFQRLDNVRDDFTVVLEESIPALVTDSHHLSLFPFRIEQLSQTIPEDAIVIYYDISEDSFTILAVDHTGLRAIFSECNPFLTPESLENAVMIYIHAIRRGWQTDAQMITKYTNHLSKLLLHPVQEVMEDSDHVIFVPSGALARLPFSALKLQNDYLIFRKQVSQVPSLAALYHLRHDRKPYQAGSVCVIARPGTPRDRFLPMAGIEAMVIARLTGTAAINARDITRAQFQSYLRTTDILHICTHGVFDAGHDLNSYLLFKERIRVLDMLAVQSEVALVTFSACLSGAGQASHAGDVQGFSHALLAAGANAFIGALWEVNDVATMIHMYLFYRLLMFAPESISIAEAWQQATILLYGLTAEDAVAWAEMAIGVWDTVEEEGGNPNGFVRNGKKKLEDLVCGWKEGRVDMRLNFKDPKIWAPFILVGNGSLRLHRSSEEDNHQKQQDHGETIPSNHGSHTAS